MNGSEIIRYSGSPLPMGFGEARQQKSLCQVTFDRADGKRSTRVELLDIPVFQQLERISGDWQAIAARLAELKVSDSRAWLEVVYQGEEIITDLRERLDNAIAGTGMDILRVKNSRIIDRVLDRMDDQETLDDLDVTEVFERCLTQHDVTEEQRPVLMDAYREILRGLHDEDPLAQGGER